MSYRGTDTASALGVMDQDAASDGRVLGAAILRRTVQTANLLRDHPTTVTGVSLPLDASEEEVDAHFAVELDIGSSAVVMVWGGPWWPAHTGYSARLRVRQPSGATLRWWLEAEGQAGTRASATGTGSWQTVTLTGGLRTSSRAVRWTLRVEPDGGTALAAQTSDAVVVSGASFPYTWGSGDSLGPRALLPDQGQGSPPIFSRVLLETGRYGVVYSRGSVPLWTRRLTGTVGTVSAADRGIRWGDTDLDVLRADQRADTQTGDVVTIIDMPRAELAGLTIVGGL